MNTSLIAVAILLSKVAAIGSVGFGVSTALEWFHSNEFKPKKSKKEGRSHGSVDNLRKKVRSQRQL